MSDEMKSLGTEPEVTLKTSTGMFLPLERYNQLIEIESSTMDWRVRAFAAQKAIYDLTGVELNDQSEILDNYHETRKFHEGIPVPMDEATKDWLVPICHDQGMTLGDWVRKAVKEAIEKAAAPTPPSTPHSAKSVPEEWMNCPTSKMIVSGDCAESFTVQGVRHSCKLTNGHNGSHSCDCIARHSPGWVKIEEGKPETPKVEVIACHHCHRVAISVDDLRIHTYGENSHGGSKCAGAWDIVLSTAPLAEQEEIRQWVDGRWRIFGPNSMKDRIAAAIREGK